MNESQGTTALPDDPNPSGRDTAMVSRRRWLQLAAGGSVGLALDGVIDVTAVRAATKDLKLANVTEVTTSCNFCSCGCGMIASVREGKLVSLEGDFDHVVNRGSLCAKGLLDVPDPRVAAPEQGAALPRAGQRPLGGDHLGRGGRQNCPEAQETARRVLDSQRGGSPGPGPAQPDPCDRVPARCPGHDGGMPPSPK